MDTSNSSNFSNSSASTPHALPLPQRLEPDASLESASKKLVLGGGCFWCVEAVFRPLQGVLQVVSGYAGGAAAEASYPQVCSGQTDHAEVVEITYDPQQISRGQLLQVFFFVAHDPTQWQGQGADVGRQYRSLVAYQTQEERQQLEDYLHTLNQGGYWQNPLVTEILPLDAFYPAEPEHQNYAYRNPQQPYIQGVALPKVTRLKQTFRGLLQS